MESLGDVITDDGFVRYHLLLQDAGATAPSTLAQNLERVRNHVTKGVVQDRQAEDLAFYCNAYNLYSISLATEKLRKSDKRWKGNVSFFERAKFFVMSSVVVAGKKTNLKNLEDRVIRRFADPRIHCAINCSSYSCPPLPKALYDADHLSEQLDEQARRFVNSRGVQLHRSKKTAQLSAIFDWFAGDFRASEHGSAVAFINHYLQEGQITEDMKISYMPYDWSVNWARDSAT